MHRHHHRLTRTAHPRPPRPRSSGTSTASFPHILHLNPSRSGLRPASARQETTTPGSSFNSKPKQDLASLPTHTLQDRLQSQRQLLASLDAGMLALPDNGQRIRDTIAAIESILTSRLEPPPTAGGFLQNDDDALVKRMQAVSLSSPTSPPHKLESTSSSKFHSHRVHLLSDDVATKVLTQARELEKKRNMQAALARLREGTAKFHANPPSWARAGLPAKSSSHAAGRVPAQQRPARASSSSTVAHAASSLSLDLVQQHPPSNTTEENASDSDWDTDDDDDQDDFLDGLDLGYDAFSDVDEDGDTALGRMSASGMDVDSDEDDDADSGYQYRH
ncbi:hypothetical protein BCR44DRAFT_286972 [Catenaria anguillulae PL171]|uniref:Uncharacterized protein n=1 Tax=Catenaria anguillulae PL171 TaxID=765915 RepID=A0A1Y2HFM3_9FUNG|nr:hypothetical protein BCR44DRAFT_286972 [Catenaria anguillulae PL171]